MLLYLNALFAGLLILSNILAVKLFSLGEWGVLPAAVIVYVFTYPITDIIGEVYGKDAARQTVKAGLLTQIAAVIFIFAAIQLPEASFFTMQPEFESILSGSIRITIASLVSYMISQNFDVFVFHKLKEKHGDKKLWLRNNLSTSLSQLADTSLFILIAFYGTMPFAALLGLIVTQYVFKVAVALVDTPLVYFIVKLCKKEKSSQLNIAG
ncbi:queuosine precursor transporter [Mesobacillus harenae]|uniref:queuosine precursor transporter n=1 Tax=Mesobacillus harenae TaxID=2213203 RepID=UPI001580765C|nr:queuosine precursor transporter [Mesobacillus harenae]